MSYHISATASGTIDEVVDRVTTSLRDQGFGVLMDLNIQKTLKDKIGAEIPAYRVLGACNPTFAYQAISAEAHIGTMLPCNVLLRETDDGAVEISAVDPVASMQAVGNAELSSIAASVRERLSTAVQTAARE